MNSHKKVSYICITILALHLSACGVLESRLAAGTQIAAGESWQSGSIGISTVEAYGEGAESEDIDFNNQPVSLTSIAQAVIETWDAASTDTPEATQTVNTNQLTSVAATQTAQIPTTTWTATATGNDLTTPTKVQKTKKPKPTATPAPCNAIRFVSDVTIPDGTVLEPGQVFYKTWRFQNVGSCSWRPEYKIQYYGGFQLGAPFTTNLGGYVDPGGYVNIWLKMYAPPQGGSFRSEWIMLDSSGDAFGIGEFYDQPFYVEIIVVGGGIQFPEP